MQELRENELVTPGYAAQLAKVHSSSKWGELGTRHLREVLYWCRFLKASTVLDYGAGRGNLGTKLRNRRVQGELIRVEEYDPGIPKKSAAPEPAEVVVCLDVLEHVEPELLENVLQHIYQLATKGALLVIAMTPSQTFLPDGRNSHLIIEKHDWWERRLRREPWVVSQVQVIGKHCKFYLKKVAR